MERAGGDGDVGVDKGALAVGGPGADLVEVGVERDAGVGAWTGADQVGDVEGGVRDGDVNAKGFAAGDGWEGDGVVAGFESEGESAVGGIEDSGGAGADAVGTDEDLVGGGEEELGVEGSGGDVGDGAGDGGGGCRFKAEGCEG